ncbi:hypothetical protein ACFQ6Q_00785 [Streptomyces sp. NPDC056437]|uniref:hypothetical protein n=1 Tax=Streptomyces sp. NPDC056437 TaxID=3345816 RepID=UPI00369A0D93
MTHEESAESTDRDGLRPLAELSESGVLWLINRKVFHPGGMALALYVEGDEVLGWKLIRSDPNEPFSFPEDVDIDGYRKAQATMRAVLDQWEG